ncbi:MAG: hypothetical protein RJA36_1355 [Pseudomonadota bacterium]|jgi:hypothetical protein
MRLNARLLAEAEDAGASRFSEWTKYVSQITNQGVWFDLTGSAGNPRSKQWFDATPLAAQPIRQSTDGGIYHSGNVAPARKYLRFWRCGTAGAAALPMSLMLCDYLAYYPTIEDGNPDPQVMDNTQPLPRYADGRGVQMMAVTIASRTGGQQFTVTYTNSDGVAGRVTPPVTQNGLGSPGIITTSANNVAGASPTPFIPLAAGDSGVRQVESVQMLGSDTGFFALVLVRPLASSMLRAIDAPYEKDLLLASSELPVIEDDAFLSLLAMPNGSLFNLTVRGSIVAVWE